MNESPLSTAATLAATAPGATLPEAPPPAPVPARSATPANWLALTLAAVALLLGWFALLRAGDFERRLDDERVQAQAREQHSAERDRQLQELQRQWAQAQADDDLAAGHLTGAELRRRREALALLDIERLVEQVQVQLRLGAASGAALEALAAADARLERLSGAAAVRVQEALHHDLARLKAAPDLDRGQLAARLDPLLREVDGWHPTADAGHPAEAAQVPPPVAGAAAAADGWSARVRAWIAREFGDLLRIREIDTPEALRLGPAQQQLLRDRFRLGILDLREAILARDERTVRAEAAALELLLTRYFDANQPEVAAAVALLRATAAASVGGALPSLDETLGALRAARAAGAAGGA